MVGAAAKRCNSLISFVKLTSGMGNANGSCLVRCRAFAWRSVRVYKHVRSQPRTGRLPLDVGNGIGSQLGNYGMQPAGAAQDASGDRCVVFNRDRPLNKEFAIRYTTGIVQIKVHPIWMNATSGAPFSSRGPRCRNSWHVYFALCIPRVIGCLRPKPHACAVTERLAKPGRYLG